MQPLICHQCVGLSLSARWARRIIEAAQASSRVVVNLLDNAARFGRSRLLVTVRPEGDCMCLVVEDDGPGVPLDEREAVLLPSRSHETGASGLGLAIATRIVQAHDSDILVAKSRWGDASVSLPISPT